MSSPDLAEVSQPNRFDSLYKGLGYRFTDVKLLELALTHRSWCAENPGSDSNERLEFLGDAVLGLAITDELFENEPDQPEGELAKARAEIVNSPTLAETARSIDVGPLLRLGKGEARTDGHDKDSILADAMEAVIGAVYLDAGWDEVQRVVADLFYESVIAAQAKPGVGDFKTRLQERAAELGLDAPVYDVSSSGPDHGREFRSTVRIGSVCGVGHGSSKKQAHQQAAEDAIGQLAHSQSATPTVVLNDETESVGALSGGDGGALDEG